MVCIQLTADLRSPEETYGSKDRVLFRRFRVELVIVALI